jgi:hypothetical protein
MRELVILATKYKKSREAEKVFDQRGWVPVDDRSKPLPGKKVIRKQKFSTALIDVLFEHIEYGGSEE